MDYHQPARIGVITVVEEPSNGPYYVVKMGWKKGVYRDLRTAKYVVTNHPLSCPMRFDTLEAARRYYRLRFEAHYSLVDDRGYERKVVYTDGACRNNGKVGARAGMGVFFGPTSLSNFSAPLRGPKQTNQRAELVAILNAFRLIEMREEGCRWDIRTDSQYAINCITQWAARWERNGWVNTKGFPVENQDAIKPILNHIRRGNEQMGAFVTFTHVDAHSGEEGNEAADSLAQKGIDAPLYVH